MAKEIKGQMSIFDFLRPEKRRPCDYRFRRYIGQRVHLRAKEGIFTITAIFPYYTHLKDSRGNEWVGTPYDIWPADWPEEGKN